MAIHKHTYYIGVYYNGRGEPSWNITEHPLNSDAFTNVSGPHELDIEVPDEFPLKDIAANIDKSIDAVRAAAEVKINQFKQAKNNLLSLTFEPTQPPQVPDDDIPF